MDMSAQRAITGRLPTAWPVAADFRPTGLLCNGHVQTIAAAGVFCRLALRDRAARLAVAAQSVVLDLPHGVRLGGVYTPQRQMDVRGLAILLHGWEGSVDSNYMVHAGARLLAEGWNVFRLNFRDHGGTSDLNRELFHSCLLQEVVDAVREATRRWRAPGQPVALAGFSLGGNFALRVARDALGAGLQLDRVVAVCPVIDPAASMVCLEQGWWVYDRYFMRSWRQSLRRKQRIFPDEAYFEPGQLRQGLRELTRTLIERRTTMGSLENYLDGYSVAGNRLGGLAVPTSLLAARDDPIIPVAGFENLTLPAHVELDIADHGGHCGFMRDWRFRSFIDDYIVARFNAAAA